MITRDDMIKVIRQKERANSKEIKEKAAQLVLRCSDEIAQGTFKVYPTPNSQEIFSLVKATFEKEGIGVKMSKIEGTAKSKKNKAYVSSYGMYEFFLLEE